MSNILTILINIIIYSGIMQGLYSTFILMHTRLRNPANKYLAYLLVLLSINILHSVLIRTYIFEHKNTELLFKEPFMLFLIPILWMYVKKLENPEYRFKKRVIIHFVPFVAVLLFSTFLVIHYNRINNNDILISHINSFSRVIAVIAFFQYLFYLIYIFKLIHRFRAKTLHELSNIENYDLTWLRVFLYTFLVVFILVIATMVVTLHNLDVSYFHQSVLVIFTLVIYILGYKGIFQQTILPQRNSAIGKSLNTENSKSGKADIDEELLNHLLEFMKSDKPFYDSELTLTSLAEQINMNRNRLSEIINTGTGGNFHEFVNKYRVEEVKQLMITPKYKEFTLLAIAFEAGFSSKSTFNSIFKEYTGLTPSQYRSKLSQVE